MMSFGHDAELAAAFAQAQKQLHPINRMAYANWLWVMGDIRGKQVLDLGCGWGYSSRMLKGRGAIVTGVDHSEHHIALAEADNPANAIEYHHENVDLLHLPSGVFDIVSPTFLLQCAPTRAVLEGFIEAMARHLRPGGRMVGLNSVEFDPIVPKGENAGHWTEWASPRAAWGDGEKIRLHLLGTDGTEQVPLEYYWWAKSTYKDLLQKYGFSNIRWIPHSMPDTLRAQYPSRGESDIPSANCVISADFAGCKA